jgi:penicillin amidase
LLIVLLLLPVQSGAADLVMPSADELATRVTIYRDSFGVPHIDADDSVAAAFGLAYAQCEDYFWQVEESLVWGAGRSAELYGKGKLEDDLITHAFEIPSRSQKEFSGQPEVNRRIAEAFAAGINYYLAHHPEVTPRLLTKVEPWHVLAFGRRTYLEICFMGAHVNGRYRPERHGEAYEQIGSNAWAVGPSKTKNGSTMLFINPHQPYYGFGQWYEAHIRTRDGIDFYGATFYCIPTLTIGHNRHCGWSFTFNEPDCADIWHVKFDNADNPDAYRYGDKVLTAAKWTADIKIKGAPARRYTFRKTHQGPVLRMAGPDGNTGEVVQVAKLYDNDFLGQVLEMQRAENVHDIRQSMTRLGIPVFNCVSADDSGNIFYAYNGIIPRRNPDFNWQQPVDGNDPATEWHGFHEFCELPAVLNPPSDYVQSCNSSPFTTTDDGNPSKDDFLPYMVMDQDVDKRRSKMSRKLLREADDLTLSEFEKLGFDTTLYWAMNELPRLREEFDRLKETNPELVVQAQPYIEHFDGWDCTVAPNCTRSPLCVAWYEELYGLGYPAETLKDEFKEHPEKKFEALITAADKVALHHATWKPKWSDVYRMQRHHDVADLMKLPLSDRKPSIPCIGAPGPLGTIFTVYYSPSIYIPFVRETRKRYAVVGSSYMGVVEFHPEHFASRSLIQFGSSSDPDSPHYFDQAELMSQRTMKPTLFDWSAIQTNANRSYHPGGEVGFVAVENESTRATNASVGK